MTTIVVEKDVRIPMRDGVALLGDVYRPWSDADFPVLVQRTPYDKNLTASVSAAIDPVRAAQSGYAVLVQDVRGTGMSEGGFQPFKQEIPDGADTLAWVEQQSWSNGKAGMIGASYVGATQWLASLGGPLSLRALAPQLTAANYYEGWTYQGGAFQLGFLLSWTLLYLAPSQAVRGPGALLEQKRHLDSLGGAADDLTTLYQHLPLTEVAILSQFAEYYFDWLNHPTYDESWRSVAPREQYGNVTVPALNIGGWYDLFLGGTLENYTGMKQRGGTRTARDSQQLIVGPWAHGMTYGTYADRTYGYTSALDALDLTGRQLRWFDRWLRDSDNNVERDPSTRLFVMGTDVWRTEQSWPLPDTEYRSFYLHSLGHANSRHGDGLLSTDPPLDEVEDAYLYDPRDPVPTAGGATYLPGVLVAANSGPRDQRAVENRDDVLCYTTEPLTHPTEVTGPVRLVLFASSSALDTDFTAKLVDVAPDGRAEILTDGILRARYRDSFQDPSHLEPGRVYEFNLDLTATANVFSAGHRIRLEISSSNFPRFDRNTNTGGEIAREGSADLVRALNRVHHNRMHFSRLILPVIDRR